MRRIAAQFFPRVQSVARKTESGVSFLHGNPIKKVEGSPLVVFCHPTGFNKEVWLPVIEELASIAHPFEWVSLDFGGHGSSYSMEGKNTSWDGFAVKDIEDVLKAVDGEKKKPIVGVGHSFGGASLVLTELARPSTFKNLVLFEPILLAEEESAANILKNTGEEFFLAAMARRRKPEWDSWEDAMEYFSTRKQFSRFRKDALLSYVAMGGLKEERADLSLEGVEKFKLVLSCKREVEAEMYYGVSATGEARNRLKGLQSIVDMAIGEETVEHNRTKNPMSPDFGEIATKFSNPRVSVAANCGHFLVMEDPVFAAKLVSSTESFQPLLKAKL